MNGAASGTKVTITTKGSFSTYLLSIDIQYTSNVDNAWTALKKKLAANTTYNFKALNGYSSGEYPSSVSATSGTGGTATLSGFKYDSANYGLQSGTTNATISVPVSGNCTIKVYVSYGGSPAFPAQVRPIKTPAVATTRMPLRKCHLLIQAAAEQQ